MNPDELNLNNKSINSLFLKSIQDNDLITIEGTVDTGFERVALQELKRKFSNLQPCNYCSSPGRIYFNCSYNDLNKVSLLRSIDHYSIIVHSDNISFTNNKDEDLQIFKNVASSIEMSKGLDIWRLLSNVNDKITFRVTAHRSYTHSFGSMEAAAVFGGAINDRFNWPVSMELFNLQILLYIIGARLTIALRVTTKSNHKRNIIDFGPTTLRATVCYNLLQLADPKPGDIVIDPLCGGASIPIECALAFPQTLIFCGDNNEKAINRTANNLNQYFTELNRVNQISWDATQLPLKTNSIDIIVSDLPFGKRSGNCSDNRVLYKKLLYEFGRVARVNSAKMVLLTNDRRSLKNALTTCERHFWNKSQLLAVKLGGLKPLVICFKRNKLQF